MSTKVPNWWMLWSDGPRQKVITLLKEGEPLERMPSYWRYKTHEDRCAMIKRLHEQGSLTDRQLNALFGNLITGERQVPPKQLYLVGDRSKTRILPPVYHRLDQVWMCSNHTGIDPEVMNTNHLRNTLLLLKESHGNVMDKMAMSLGAIHTALRNQPGLQEEAVRFFNQLLELDVDDLYPVFNALQAEYVTRTDMPVKDARMILNGIYTLGDAEIDDQMDIDFNLKGW